MPGHLIRPSGAFGILGSGALAVTGAGGNCPECCGEPTGVPCLCSVDLGDDGLAGYGLVSPGVGGLGLVVSGTATLTSTCLLTWEGYTGGGGGGTLCNVSGAVVTAALGEPFASDTSSCNWQAQGATEGSSDTISIGGVPYVRILGFGLGFQAFGEVTNAAVFTRPPGAVRTGSGNARRGSFLALASAGDNVSFPIGGFGPAFRIPGISLTCIANLLRGVVGGNPPAVGGAGDAVPSNFTPTVSLTGLAVTASRAARTVTVASTLRLTHEQVFPRREPEGYEAGFLSVDHLLESTITVSFAQCLPAGLRSGVGGVNDPRVVDAAERLLRLCRGCGEA